MVPAPENVKIFGWDYNRKAFVPITSEGTFFSDITASSNGNATNFGTHLTIVITLIFIIGICIIMCFLHYCIYWIYKASRSVRAIHTSPMTSSHQTLNEELSISETNFTCICHHMHSSVLDPNMHLPGDLPHNTHSSVLDHNMHSSDLSHDIQSSVLDHNMQSSQDYLSSNYTPSRSVTTIDTSLMTSFYQTQTEDYSDSDIFSLIEMHTLGLNMSQDVNNGVSRRDTDDGPPPNYLEVTQINNSIGESTNSTGIPESPPPNYEDK